MMTAEHIALMRKAALKLMGDLCSVCGESDEAELEVHHDIQSNLGPGRGQDRRAWEALRLAVTDEGRIMCRRCHRGHHARWGGTYEGDYYA